MMHRSSSSSVILLPGDDMAGGCLCASRVRLRCVSVALLPTRRTGMHPLFVLTFGQAVRVIIALEILGEMKKD